MPTEPAAIAVEDRMYRWLAVLRFVLVANAVGLNIYRGGFAHPVGAGFVLAGMVVWTFVISWVYHAYSRRTTVWVVADLAVALAALGLTAAVKEPGFHSTVPGFWVMAAMFAWAIHWRLYGGLVAAVLLSVDDFATRHYLSETIYGNLFLLLIGGPIVGLMVDSLLRSAARTAAAERAAAAAAERTRLARAVHDGVLQVLALVQRRGPELGPDGVRAGAAGRRAGAGAALADPAAGRRRPDARRGRPGRRAVGARAPAAASRWRRPRAAYSWQRSRGRDRRRRLGLPRQRRRPRRARRSGLGAARGRRRTRCVVSVRDDGPGHPGRAGSRRPSGRAGWASPRRSAAGSPSSAVRPS